MSLLDNLPGLWWVAITSTAAAVATLYGAMAGAREHRAARLMLGIAVAAVAMSYWWDIAPHSTIDGPAQMRRGAGVVLWPAILWTALSGVRYLRARHKVAADIVAALDPAQQPGQDGPE